ncbi:MAG TPA: GxxExxY protein [Acidobacteriota bacterium]|jgi:GxxExxY protein
MSSKEAPAPIPGRVNEIATSVLDSAFKVHSELGPGLLENVYEACLAYDILQRGLLVQRQAPFPLCYHGVRLDIGFRIDLLVEGCLIVEVKAVDALHPVHTAQVLSYLKLTGNRLGLLINFNVAHLRDGIRRVAL